MNNQQSDITVYHLTNSRSVRVLWLLEELKLPYTLVGLDFIPGHYGGDSYTKVHPLNKVPAVRDGDMVMYESVAILQYILDLYTESSVELRPNISDPLYGPYLQWLHYGESTLAPVIVTLMRQRHFLKPEERSPLAEAQAVAELEKVLSLLETQLGDHDYVLPSGFSAADISVGYCLLLLRLAKAKAQITPRLEKYWKLITSRDAWAKVSKL